MLDCRSRAREVAFLAAHHRRHTGPLWFDALSRQAVSAAVRSADEKLFVVSRTFNNDPDGSYGQYVPAVAADQPQGAR